jgi:hypothetical protein
LRALKRFGMRRRALAWRCGGPQDSEQHVDPFRRGLRGTTSQT